MAFNVSTFLTRLGSAAVFSAFMLVGLLWNEWAFVLLFFLINFLCLKEFATMLENILDTKFTRNEIANYLFMGMISFALIAILPLNECHPLGTLIFEKYFFYFLGMLIGGVGMFWYFKQNKKAFYLFTGLGYITLALGLLVQLRFQSLLIPLALILMIWMNDTMAYLCGSFLGKTPFFPSISPKKTVEGTLGGILFTLAFAYVWYYFSDAFRFIDWMMLGGIASLIGTIGDLIESKLKRMAGVKDSGRIMPGHGGALDRFDSLLLASPFAFLYAIVFLPCHNIHIF